MSRKYENLIALRLHNAQLLHGVSSRPARRAVRRIRAGLARRGITTAQREEALHDALLMIAEVETAGGDPVEALLGSASAADFNEGIGTYCDGVAAECSRLPVPLVITRFFALMAVALAMVLAAHLAFRVSRETPGGWLPFWMITLRNEDISMLQLELLAVPVLFLVAQIVSSLIPCNPWPHGLPVVLTPILFFALLALLGDTGIVLPDNILLYNPLAMTDGTPLLELPAVTEQTISFPFAFRDYSWLFNVNRFLLAAGIAVIAIAGLGITYFIERRRM